MDCWRGVCCRQNAASDPSGKGGDFGECPKGLSSPSLWSNGREIEGAGQDDSAGAVLGEGNSKAGQRAVVEKKHLATANAFPCSLWVLQLPCLCLSCTHTRNWELDWANICRIGMLCPCWLPLNLQQPALRHLLKEKNVHFLFLLVFCIGTAPCTLSNLLLHGFEDTLALVIGKKMPLGV